jgi:hypothetical protein
MTGSQMKGFNVAGEHYPLLMLRCTIKVYMYNLEVGTVSASAAVPKRIDA